MLKDLQRYSTSPALFAAHTSAAAVAVAVAVAAGPLRALANRYLGPSAGPRASEAHPASTSWPQAAIWTQQQRQQQQRLTQNQPQHNPLSHKPQHLLLPQQQQQQQQQQRLLVVQPVPLGSKALQAQQLQGRQQQQQQQQQQQKRWRTFNRYPSCCARAVILLL
jgi:hypothetical protein